MFTPHKQEVLLAMSLADQVLAVNDDLPIRTDKPVHSGKVRSVYWLTPADSARLIKEKGYDVPADAPLALMVISDRISAFDCIWQGVDGLNGVPGKGAALNAISSHWFKLFKEKGLADSHILDIPHPFVWIVQKARPVMIEAIARQYITGSMWRAYKDGEREFCGITLPEGLKKDQKLPEILITPSTKGVLTGLDGVPEADDVNVSRADIERHYKGFNFSKPADIDRYEVLLKEGFNVISEALAALDQVAVVEQQVVARLDALQFGARHPPRLGRLPARWTAPAVWKSGVLHRGGRQQRCQLRRRSGRQYPERQHAARQRRRLPGAVRPHLPPRLRRDGPHGEPDAR